ncbi:uncharacterized protein LOC116348640 isoform X2 [Contarinia nasturtii]|uniref:uncharacterized protein LOC116348640 isoform X2 n=1 Tax=Contarinia nasturtii TaxID=265458 RepID=UPI0012D44A71|nr:uncharacterized protein LOC116348640 isoform X2 [Contarinia nasturtii]
MYEDKSFSGIYAHDCPGISFGQNFSSRNSNIDEIHPTSESPTIVNHKDQTSKLMDTPSSSKELPVHQHKWPENENTYMIELIEKHTIVDRTYVQVNSDAAPNGLTRHKCFCPEDIFVDYSPRKQIPSASTTYTVGFGDLAEATLYKCIVSTPEVKSNVQRIEMDRVQKTKSTENYYAQHREFTYNDGEFPVKSNRSELNWSCVPLGKGVTKSFRIKNISDKWMAIQLEAIGTSFEITSHGGKGKLILHGNEIRQIDVTFYPSYVGANVGKIVFKPANNWPDGTMRFVYLFAYGGTAMLKLRGVERNFGNAATCLRLEVNETTSRLTSLTGYFSIFNTSPVDGVVIMFIKPKMGNSSSFTLNESQIFIQSKKHIIKQSNACIIPIFCQLRHQDLEQIQMEFSEDEEDIVIATIGFYYGPEPNRQRIIKILQQNRNDSSLNKMYDVLRQGFPPTDNDQFDEFRDRIENAHELYAQFLKSEIELVIKRSCLHDAFSSTAYITCTDKSRFDDTNNQ